MVGYTTTYAISAYHHLWVQIPFRRGVLVTTLCDSLTVTCGRSVVFSTNKTDCHDITEILLKMALNTITLTPVLYHLTSGNVLYHGLYNLHSFCAFLWNYSHLIWYSRVCAYGFYPTRIAANKDTTEQRVPNGYREVINLIVLWSSCLNLYPSLLCTCMFTTNIIMTCMSLINI